MIRGLNTTSLYQIDMAVIEERENEAISRLPCIGEVSHCYKYQIIA